LFETAIYRQRPFGAAAFPLPTTFHVRPPPNRVLVSDGTGITVEMLGHSLLTQFDGVESTHETIPFIDSVAKAEACVTRINAAQRPAASVRSSSRPW